MTLATMPPSSSVTRMPRSRPFEAGAANSEPSSFSVDQIMETLQSHKVADNLVPLADVPIEPVDRFKM